MNDLFTCVIKNKGTILFAIGVESEWGLGGQNFRVRYNFITILKNNYIFIIFMLGL